MEPNRLEEEFREKLEQRTIQPSKMAWDRLDAMLSVNEEKMEQKVIIAKKPNRSWMYMAASLVLFATIGTYFLTRETGNSNSPENTGTPVVNTEKPVEAEGNHDTAQPSGAQQAADNLFAPIREKEAVANNGKAISKQKHGVVTVNSPSQPSVCTAPPAPSDEYIAVADNNHVDKLLADASHPAPKKKSAVKVDASSLLSSVEGELDESFRDKALQGVIKNFNAVKSSVANRNYQ
ncbi:hypothetical protein [uncultured Flavobacterium sp.]|uniref:hypothetical protein n=1 Tax=uncultured Flavobacterium sp. TaxID=165435 RepID=UPI0025F86C94|nr:hypothetical protein [uncultured Flavobacterium sp.]